MRNDESLAAVERERVYFYSTKNLWVRPHVI